MVSFYTLVENLEIGRISHVKGTITRGATSLNYVHMVLLPVLSSLFDHVGLNQFGNDLIGMKLINSKCSKISNTLLLVFLFSNKMVVIRLELAKCLSE